MEKNLIKLSTKFTFVIIVTVFIQSCSRTPTSSLHLVTQAYETSGTVHLTSDKPNIFDQIN